jgi:hypothetical protein
MRRGRRTRLLWALVLLASAAGARAAEEFSFDSSEFERKPFEIGGYAQLKQEDFFFNRGAAFYELNNAGEPQRERLDRTTATLQLAGKLRYGMSTFDFRTNSDQAWDQLGHTYQNKIYEAALSLRPDPGLTVEAGKRVLRWGKGYAWNPIGFVERPKDPNDPQLAREGFVLADADLIFNPGGDLQTLAFTPVLLPVSEDVNSDFGASGHWNPAAKLYLLYRGTDIDFAWQGKGSRPARYGMDFSTNLSSNFEIHGEWARILDFQKPIVNGAGQVTTETGDATSYLLGLRYLTASDTTCIAEYYRNGTGYSEEEFRQFYDFVAAALAQTGSTALLERAQSLSQGYGRPYAGESYVYLRVQQKDGLGIVYFQPAITAIVNAWDGSWQVTPELLYTGIKNLELRFRFSLLHGNTSSDFGEKPNSQKLEVYARYYF